MKIDWHARLFAERDDPLWQENPFQFQRVTTMIAALVAGLLVSLNVFLLYQIAKGVF